MPEPATKKTRVLIIGGGFTGISAAADLAAAGVDFQLLEAHPARIGGRVRSFGHRVGDPGSREYFFEHGAQYIGASQSEIFQLAQRHLPHAIIDGFAARLPWSDQVTVLQGKRHVNSRDEWLFGIGGIPPELDVWTTLAVLLLIQEIEAIERAIHVTEPWASPPEIAALDEVTLAQWFSRPWIPPHARDLVTISVQALLSAEAHEISALYFFWYCACNGGFLNLINDEAGGPQQYYLATGLGALLERIAAPFQDRIHVGCPVARVAQKKRANGSGYVQVTLQDGAVWEADKVIVAMSPSTAGRLSYDPPLQGERKALFSVPMGRTIKCVVFYDTPWWRDSHGRRYSGYAGAASSPVLWVMDNSPPGPENKGVHALMTFTVGEAADSLGPYPSREAVERHVTEALAFLFDDPRALSTSPHFIELVSATWNPAESWVGGGPNMLLKPGMLTGSDRPARLLNEPWNDLIYFASAETARKLAPSGAPTWTPGADPTQPGVYSDHRQGLGYLDGAVIAGRYVAAQVRGAAPPPASPSPASAVPSAPPPEPPQLTPEQVKQALTILAQTLHAATAIDVAAWEAPPEPWRRDPAALQAWLVQALVGALVQAGLLSPPPDPPTPEWMAELTGAAIALVGSGYKYVTQNAPLGSPARRATIRSIQELTGIVGALMRLKSTEPFVAPPVQAGSAPGRAPGRAPAPAPAPAPASTPAPTRARLTSLSRMLARR